METDAQIRSCIVRLLDGGLISPTAIDSSSFSVRNTVDRTIPAPTQNSLSCHSVPIPDSSISFVSWMTPYAANASKPAAANTARLPRALGAAQHPTTIDAARTSAVTRKPNASDVNIEGMSYPRRAYVKSMNGRQTL